MKTISAVFFAAMLVLASDRLSAQPSPSGNVGVADNGGRLGITVDNQSYSVGDVVAVRVTGLTDKSPMNRIIRLGDYIYKINNTNTGTVLDTVDAVKVLAPWSHVTIYWIDSTNNFQRMRTETYTLAVDAAPITLPLSCAPYVNLAVETGDYINRMRNSCSLFAKMDANFDGPMHDLIRKWRPQFIRQRDADRLALRESRTASEFFATSTASATHHKEASDWVQSLPGSECKQPR